MRARANTKGYNYSGTQCCRCHIYPYMSEDINHGAHASVLALLNILKACFVWMQAITYLASLQQLTPGAETGVGGCVCREVGGKQRQKELVTLSVPPLAPLSDCKSLLPPRSESGLLFSRSRSAGSKFLPDYFADTKSLTSLVITNMMNYSK